MPLETLKSKFYTCGKNEAAAEIYVLSILDEIKIKATT